MLEESEDRGMVTVYAEYVADHCNCDFVSAVLYRVGSSNTYKSADKAITLESFNTQISISNKKSEQCCEIGADLYDAVRNWSLDYENEQQWEEYHEPQGAENYMTPISDTTVSAYISAKPHINSDMSFLNGSWKSRDVDLFYNLKFNDSLGGLAIFNGDDELMFVLNPVDFCGSYDHVFSIILSEEGNCWYIDIIDEQNITVYRGKEQGLEEYFDIVKVSDYNPVENSSFSGLVFDTQTCDFGTIQQGDAANFTFYYENHGTEPINIISVESNCGCVIVLGEFGEVEPESRGHFKIMYDSGRVGSIDKEVTIITNSGRQVLKVIGRVE